LWLRQRKNPTEKQAGASSIAIVSHFGKFDIGDGFVPRASQAVFLAQVGDGRVNKVYYLSLLQRNIIGRSTKKPLVHQVASAKQLVDASPVPVYFFALCSFVAGQSRESKREREI